MMLEIGISTNDDEDIPTSTFSSLQVYLYQVTLLFNTTIKNGRN